MISRSEENTSPLNRNRKLTKFIKCILSLWIVFHVFLIVVLPNSSSYLGRILPQWAVAYGNSLAMHSNWNFFSPDPAHSMYFHYKVYFQEPGIQDSVTSNMDSESQMIEGYLPTYKMEREMSLVRRRELYEMRFMVLNTRRIHKFIAPWLCKKFPGAKFIQVEHQIETIAPLDVAAFEKSSMEDLSNKIEFVNYSFDCRGGFDDVEI